MKKYIDADALYEKIHNIGGCDAPPDTWAEGWDEAIDECLNLLESMPAADVQEVRHGRWIKGKIMGLFKCSACHNTFDYWVTGYNHCPNCGARMDGGE